MRKENPEIANFQETKLFRHILHLLWSHGLSSGLSAWLLTSVVWFYLLLPVYGQRRLLQGLNWQDLHSRGQRWGRRTWSRKSELLTPGLVNLGPGTTRHGSETLYWSQCDAVVIKKKSVHLSLASPELSPGSSAVGKLMGEEREQVEELVEGVSGQPGRGIHRHPPISIARAQSPDPSVQRRPGNSVHPWARQ